MKSFKFKLENWLLLFVGFLIFGLLNHKPKRTIPQDPPKLSEFKESNCSYFWFQNWDGNFVLQHKFSCTNSVHPSQIFIQLNQVNPPAQKQGLRTVF